MVSPLSARLLAGRGDSPSYSSKDTRSSQPKRTFSGVTKSGNGGCCTTKNATSTSGYSADKEGPATYLPAIVSIDLHGRGEHSAFSRDATNCPKRRKRIEMQFAASSVKTDLERAGVALKTMNKDIESSDSPGGITINLKGVRLIHSPEVDGPLVSSNVAEKATVADYQILMKAVSGSYPPITQRTMSFDRSSSMQDTTSSDQSTSSVSDTESDSGCDNINSTTNHILFIPPLVEDTLDQSNIANQAVTECSSSCNVISCASNAVTMSEMLQLSSSARVVTKSTAPFSVIHANAAFLRLSGTQGAETVLGRPFLSLLESSATTAGPSSQISLTECMMASSMGNDLKLFLIPPIRNGHDDFVDGASLSLEQQQQQQQQQQRQQPVECHVRVSPIVARKTESREVTSVTHFAIELYNNESGSATNTDRANMVSTMSAIPEASTATSSANLPVGVMG